MNYVILGSGIAAMTAAEEIRSRDSSASIIMITNEKRLCPNRPMLIMDLAVDGSGASLFEKQREWPAQHDVEMLQGVDAKAIHRAEKTVLLSDGRNVGYDKLIYALGAKAMVPGVAGADGSNVFSVRTLDDTERIREAIRTSKSAVVIGGGMLGLENAWALYNEGLDVTILEKKSRVAFGQIDGSAGNLMKKRIERFGVDIRLNVDVEEIGDGFVTFREEGGCGSGRAFELVTIPADLIILSAGVVPNSAIGKEGGLDTVGGCWIRVDEHCRTSDGDIFAAGDVASIDERGDAIWDAAREMGRIAGANAFMDLNEADERSADRPTYRPVVAEHVFNGFDTEVFTAGDSSGAATDGVHIRHADVEIFDYQRERYIRVSLQDGTIAGILLINAPELAPELMEAMKQGEGEDTARDIILRWRNDHEVDFKPAVRED